MMKKCKGCGAVLQTDMKEEIGYVVAIENDICNRCFRLKHYSEYQKIEKNKEEYISILKQIDQKKELIVLVVDLFFLNKEVFDLKKYIKSDVLLVLSKRDVLPLSLKDEKLKKYMESLELNMVDIEIISAKKNYQLDSLYAKIQKYQKGSSVYVVGFTNAGKSTLINKLIYNYADVESDIMTSIMPSTTLDSIEVKLGDSLTLIDTPGLLATKSFMNVLDGKTLSRVMPLKEIKPIIYQIHKPQFIWIEDLFQIATSSNNLALYFSNRLFIDRGYKNKKDSFAFSKEILVKAGEELVIEGLGFIKFSKTETITYSINEDIDVYTRKAMIGNPTN